jgi:hypothetical protein
MVNKKWKLSIIMIFSFFNVLNAQNMQNEEAIAFGNKWDENWFDSRMIDIPQIGIFFDLKNNNNILFRMSLPMPFPFIFITPINATYASSYWGFNVFLCDITFGTEISESDLLKVRELLANSKNWPIEFISEADAKSRLFTTMGPFIFVHNFRLLPLSIWGGFPLSSKGGGLYIFGEVAPLSWFKSFTDKYENWHFGIGFNTGLKFIFTKHYEVEIKWENYYNYEGFEYMDSHFKGFSYMNSYIGLTFKYRLFEPRYYGIW